jgi:hypothetical protein
MHGLVALGRIPAGHGHAPAAEFNKRIVTASSSAVPARLRCALVLLLHPEIDSQSGLAVLPYKKIWGGSGPKREPAPHAECSGGVQHAARFMKSPSLALMWLKHTVRLCG